MISNTLTQKGKWTIAMVEISSRGDPESIPPDVTMNIVKQCGFEFEVDDVRVKIIAYIRRE